MPDADVTVSAVFSSEPAGTGLSYLAASRGSFKTEFQNSVSSYETDDIPHIFDKTLGAASFFIEAVPEDPNADITVTAPSGGGTNLFGESIALAEGITAYTIKAVPASGAGTPKTYTLSVSYEPDLTLGAVTLTTPETEGADWGQKLSAANLGNVFVPWQQRAVAASPNAAGTGTAALVTKTGGHGTFGSGTLDFGMGTVTNLNIQTSKAAGGKTYTRDYPLTMTRVTAAGFPTEFLASGGGESFILVGGTYQEVHVFTLSDGPQALVFNGSPPAGLTARVLVVAGGGGAGGAQYPASGAGAGGMVENDSFALTAGSYQVVVGNGGLGGADKTTAGTKGGDSSFGGIIVAYGGGASAQRDYYTNAGKSGGSGGGGYPGGSVQAGTGGEPYGFPGGDVSSNEGNYTAGGGGAGGQGSAGYESGEGGLGGSNDITGESIVYAAGGGTASSNPGKNGAANTGNGGNGGWQSRGGNGGSGIVVVRFPAKVPSAQ
jgi:hypothetical protein